MRPGPINRALILVDIQVDFLPGGRLAVPDGDEILPVVNKIQDKFDLVVATQDWHPHNHKSFSSNNPSTKPFDMGELGGKPQIMWPNHCEVMSTGAMLAPKLDQSYVAAVFRKGMDPEVDSYSGFSDNNKSGSTGLDDYLSSHHITDVYVAGLATNYCVKFTATDALGLGYGTHLVLDGCRGIEPGIQDVLDEMSDCGIELVTSENLVWK